jgi:hypothetical protein
MWGVLIRVRVMHGLIDACVVACFGLCIIARFVWNMIMTSSRSACFYHRISIVTNITTPRNRDRDGAILHGKTAVIAGAGRGLDAPQVPGAVGPLRRLRLAAGASPSSPPSLSPSRLLPPSCPLLPSPLHASFLLPSLLSFLRVYLCICELPAVACISEHSIQHRRRRQLIWICEYERRRRKLTGAQYFTLLFQARRASKREKEI